MNKEMSNSFILDVKVITEETIILEIHSFVLIGLYSSVWN